MINVICHTNLDLRGERWPDKLSCVPRVGDVIESATRWGVFSLTLKVVSITYICIRHENIWIPKIELHMTDFQCRLECSKGEQSRGSITAFYEWYAPLVGSRVSAFI